MTSLATIKDSLSGGAASFSATETRYKLNKEQAASDAAFVTVSNKDAISKKTATSFDDIVTTPTWIHKVKVGDQYADAPAGNNAAYAVITATLNITGSASEGVGGNYVVTISKGTNYDAIGSYFVILVEDDWGSDEYAALDFDAHNNVFSKPVTTAAGAFTFKMILWLDGTLGEESLPEGALSAQQLITIDAAYVA